MATSALLHKVKVKEETKECCSYPQSSSTSTAASAIGSCTAAANIADNGNSSSVSTATSTTTIVAAKASSPATHQTPALVPHPASSVLVNVDPCPVDLDLKTKAKGSFATREKSSREDARSEAHSPPSHQQRISSGAPATSQSKQSNGTRTEYKETSSCSASSDTDSPLPSHPESEDTNGCGSSNATNSGPAPIANCRTEEQNATANNTNSSGNRCIAGVFAAHGELKSVLGTVVKFATGISSDTGDTVLTFVLALLSGGMTAEEFHSALQEATNYSLKDFVLPHLKQQLPSLRRDLSNAARASNQNCAQFLRSNEAAILEAVGLVATAEQLEVFGEHTANGTASGNGSNQCSAHYALRSNSNPGVGAIQHANNATGGLHHYSSGTSHAPKRRASDTPYYENGAALLEDVPVYGKRLTNPWNHHLSQQPPSTETSSPYCWYHPLHSSGGSIQGHGHRHPHGHAHGHGHGGLGHVHGPSPMPSNSVHMNALFTGSHHATQQPHQIGHVQAQNGSLDDEWKNIHMMLNCILGMVEKTKKALAILQTRGCFGAATTTAPPLTAAANTVTIQNGNCSGAATANNPSSTQVESSSGDREGSLKRLSGEIVAQTIRAIEDKVAEVKRKDEEAVKRAVIAEVQRAVRVAVAESRANERLRVSLSRSTFDVPLSQRNHGSVRQGPYVRVQSNPGPVDANARTVPTTPTTVSNSIGEDEKDAHVQTVSGSNCWNCGRPALETCGGCGIARYCGSFCQHRDWEAGGHHATCNNPPVRERPRSASRSPPRIASTSLPSINEANVAASIPTSAASKGK